MKRIFFILFAFYAFVSASPGAITVVHPLDNALLTGNSTIPSTAIFTVANGGEIHIVNGGSLVADAGAIITGIGGGGGSGTVTSVAETVPGIFNISGSPITVSGTLAITLANENANLVFAGPSSGSPAAPTFRALGAADIPVISLTAGVSGILPVLNGGLGVATLAANGYIFGNGTGPAGVLAATNNFLAGWNGTGVPTGYAFNATTINTNLATTYQPLNANLTSLAGVTPNLTTVQAALNPLATVSLTANAVEIGNTTNAPIQFVLPNGTFLARNTTGVYVGMAPTGNISANWTGNTFNSSGGGVPSIAGTDNQIIETGSPGATTLSLNSTLILPGTAQLGGNIDFNTFSAVNGSISGNVTGFTQANGTANTTLATTLFVANATAGAGSVSNLSTGTGFTISGNGTNTISFNGNLNVGNIAPGTNGTILITNLTGCTTFSSTLAANYDFTGNDTFDSGSQLNFYGLGLSGNAGFLYAAKTTDILTALSANGNNSTVAGINATGIPTLFSTLPTAVEQNISMVGTITAGTYSASILSAAFSGTQTGATTFSGNISLTGCDTFSGFPVTISNNTSAAGVDGLVINNGQVYVPPVSNQPIALFIQANDAASAGIVYHVYGASGARYGGGRANGPAASPSALVSNNTLSEFWGNGYDGTAWDSDTNSDARMQIKTYNAWSNTDHSTSFLWFVTAPGTTNNGYQAMTLAAPGNLTLTPPTNTAAGGTTPPYFSINTTYNQTGGAVDTDFGITRTETAVGSGAQLFANFKVGATSKFSVDDEGDITGAGNLTTTNATITSLSETFLGTLYLVSNSSNGLFSVSLSPAFSYNGSNTTLGLNSTLTLPGTLALGGNLNLETYTVSNGTLNGTVTFGGTITGAHTYSGVVTASSATASTSISTGGLIVSGGEGIAGNLFVGANITGNNATITHNLTVGNFTQGSIAYNLSSPTNGYVLTYNSTSGNLELKSGGGGGVTSLNNTDGNILFSASTGAITANLNNDLTISGTMTAGNLSTAQSLLLNGSNTTSDGTNVIFNSGCISVEGPDNEYGNLVAFGGAPSTSWEVNIDGTDRSIVAIAPSDENVKDIKGPHGSVAAMFHGLGEFDYTYKTAFINGTLDKQKHPYLAGLNLSTQTAQQLQKAGWGFMVTPNQKTKILEVNWALGVPALLAENEELQNRVDALEKIVATLQGQPSPNPSPPATPTNDGAVNGTVVIKQGGTFTLSSGAVTVSEIRTTANSNIVITMKTKSGTIAVAPFISNITAGTNFTVTGSATDNSTYNYVIIDNQ